uniref:NAD-dependent epimerase/dehydratase family protein n=1 Tax=Algoriphagus sp. TaxID=1872435 RepID=UPI0040472382
MKILITGTAGFIGFHTALKFVGAGFEIIGIDNINDYYDTRLKFDRLKASGINESEIRYNKFVQSFLNSNYRFMKVNLEDADALMDLFQTEKFDMVIHLAAQAGVRYSLENPKSYIQSNVVGFLNILEACRNYNVRKLLFASSSSVYGMSDKPLLSITDNTDNPISLYAATKKSNELMAHVYSHLYNIQTIGLRFFTVYGPWGRPDMAPFLFADSIINNNILKVFNNGNMQRDFTFIDDIVEGIFSISKVKLKNKYNIFNVGNNVPVKLLEFIDCLENELKKKAIKEMYEIQAGDVIATWADTKELILATGYHPKTNIKSGVKKFIAWYMEYFKFKSIQ